MRTAAAPPPRRAGPRRGDHGSASVEFAITAVAVMAMMFAAIQAATYFWPARSRWPPPRRASRRSAAYNAAPGAGRDRAAAFAASTGDGLTGTTITVTADAEQVQVTVPGAAYRSSPASATRSRFRPPPTARSSG